MKLEKEYGEINGEWKDIKESVASKVREMIEDFSKWWNNEAKENEFGGVYLDINEYSLFIETAEDDVISNKGNIWNDAIRGIFDCDQTLCFNLHSNDWKDDIYYAVMELIEKHQ